MNEEQLLEDLKKTCYNCGAPCSDSEHCGQWHDTLNRHVTVGQCTKCRFAHEDYYWNGGGGSW